MVQYARIEDNKVKEVNDCPKNYKNVSNFYLLSDEKKINYGWYPVEKVEIVKKDWESFGEYVNQILENKVIRSRKINSLTLNEYKERKYRILANNTLEYVYSIYPAYKQATATDKRLNPDDNTNPYSIEEANKIRDFCNKHTTEVRRIKEIIFNAETYEEVQSQPEIVQYEVE